MGVDTRKPCLSLHKQGFLMLIKQGAYLTQVQSVDSAQRQKRQNRQDQDVTTTLDLFRIKLKILEKFHGVTSLPINGLTLTPDLSDKPHTKMNIPSVDFISR